jgi:hypothetical protein
VVRKLRSWNSRTGQYTWFPAGREYYEQNRQKFLINVPCLGYIPANALRQVDPEADFQADPGLDADAEGSPADAPLMRASIWGEGHQSRVIPLTPEAIENYVRPRAMLRLENLGVVRDQDHTQADIEAALRREVPALLSQLPRVSTVDGMKHKVAVESSISTGSGTSRRS